MEACVGGGLLDGSPLDEIGRSDAQELHRSVWHRRSGRTARVWTGAIRPLPLRARMLGGVIQRLSPETTQMIG